MSAIICSVTITIFYSCIVHQIISASCPTTISNTLQQQGPDYYWKDYAGAIPIDALHGGTDKAGNPTYVGQAYIPGFELLPVIIYPGCKFANTTAYASEVTTDKNIKILCGSDKRKFEWVLTKTDEEHLLINRHLVVGGYEVGHNLKIGRVQHDGQLIIGKVFSYPAENNGLYIPYNGKPVRFNTYEVLVYNQQRYTTIHM